MSVWIQSLCECQIVRVLPPTVFWPRPKVHSAIIRLDAVPEWREKFADIDHFHRTVRALFFHRRKFLRSVVISAMKEHLSKTEVDEVLNQLGHDQTARAEELPVEKIHQLAETLRLAEIRSLRWADLDLTDAAGELLDDPNPSARRLVEACEDRPRDWASRSEGLSQVRYRRTAYRTVFRAFRGETSGGSGCSSR